MKGTNIFYYLMVYDSVVDLDLFLACLLSDQSGLTDETIHLLLFLLVLLQGADTKAGATIVAKK